MHLIFVRRWLLWKHHKNSLSFFFFFRGICTFSWLWSAVPRVFPPVPPKFKFEHRMLGGPCLSPPATKRIMLCLACGPRRQMLYISLISEVSSWRRLKRLLVGPAHLVPWRERVSFYSSSLPLILLSSCFVLFRDLLSPFSIDRRQTTDLLLVSAPTMAASEGTSSFAPSLRSVVFLFFRSGRWFPFSSWRSTGLRTW